MAIDTLETRRNILTPLEKAGVAPLPKQPAVRPAPEFKELRKSLENRGVITAGKEGADLNALKKSGRDDVRHVQTRLADAGLYPATKAMNDGRIGGMTDHALKLAADEGYALEYLEKTALKGKDLNEADTMKMQAALNRLGYDTGKVDGAFGKKSATALNDFLKERPQLAANMDPSLKEAVEKNLGKGTLTQAFSTVTKIDIQAPAAPAAQPPKTDLPTRNANGHVLLRPDLIAAMERSGDIRNYVQIAQKSVEDINKTLLPGQKPMDPNMFANQLGQESFILMEARGLGPDLQGPKTRYGRAQGVAQFLPATGREYGLETTADLHNPALAIPAAARMMNELTQKHGSQELAMIEYNGGPRAIPWVAKKLGVENPNFEQVDGFFAKQRESGKVRRSSWAVESGLYARSAVSDKWDNAKIELALSKKENQVAPVKPIDLKPNEPAFAKLDDGKNITTAMKLDTTFGKAASMTGLSLAGITANVTPEQKASVAYDTATLSGKFNLAQLDMTPKTPGMDGFDPANPQIKRDNFTPVGLG